MGDRIRVHHDLHGYGTIDGKPKADVVRVSFERPAMFMAERSRIDVPVSSLQRVRLEPMGVQRG